MGTGTIGSNKAQIRQEMQDRADDGEFMGMWMAHETDEPTREAFPNGWGDIGGGSSLGLDILETKILMLCFKLYICNYSILVKRSRSFNKKERLSK